MNSQARCKLDEKCEKCIFVGYSSQSKAYKLYNPVSGKIMVNRNVVFNEDASWNFNSGNKSSNIQLFPSDVIIDQKYGADQFLAGPSTTSSIAPATSPTLEEPSAEPTPLTRSTRDRKPNPNMLTIYVVFFLYLFQILFSLKMLKQRINGANLWKRSCWLFKRIKHGTW